MTALRSVFLLCETKTVCVIASVCSSQRVDQRALYLLQTSSQSMEKQRSGLWKCHSVPGLALRGPREPGGGAWPGCRFRGDRIMCHTAAAASSSPGGWGQAERHGGGSLLHCLFHQLSGEQGARLNGHSKILHARELALSKIYSIPSKQKG